MRLAKLSEFRRLRYTLESAPAPKTVRKRIKAGEIPGGVIEGGRYYVDLDEFDRVTDMRNKIEAELAELAKNPLLKGLI